MLSTLLSLSSLASASKLALYWGQNSAGDEQSLASYCQNTPGDIYIISFINQYGKGQPMGMNIHGYYNFISGTQLLDAPGLGKDITTCQQLGKKVLISLGGSVGNYGLSSDDDAVNTANELWNYFGGGSSSTRPFGQDVKVDGFDLDSENKLDAPEYVTLANKLNQLYASDPSKQYVLSASPQCVYPDASLGDAISSSHFDYIFVQFYNNYCSIDGSSFNFKDWQKFASTQSPNRGVELLVGLAGSTSAAGSGYASIKQIAAKYPEFSNSPNFGGFSVWDASQANSNVVDGQSFAEGLENILNPKVSSSSTFSTASSTSSTTTAGESTSTSTDVSSSTSTGVPSSTTAGVSTTSSRGSSAVQPGKSTATEAVVTESTPVSTNHPDSSSLTKTSVVTPSASVNGTWNVHWSKKWTTVTDVYTTTVPCTTSVVPATGGSAIESVGYTTMVVTYTSTIPCTTTGPGPVSTGSNGAGSNGAGSNGVESIGTESVATSGAEQTDNHWATQWTTQVNEYTTTVPCTTSVVPATGGSAVETVVYSTVVSTQTSIIPCTTVGPASVRTAATNAPHENAGYVSESTSTPLAAPSAGGASSPESSHNGGAAPAPGAGSAPAASSTNPSVGVSTSAANAGYASESSSSTFAAPRAEGVSPSQSSHNGGAAPAASSTNPSVEASTSAAYAGHASESSSSSFAAPSAEGGSSSQGSQNGAAAVPAPGVGSAPASSSSNPSLVASTSAAPFLANSATSAKVGSIAAGIAALVLFF